MLAATLAVALLFSAGSAWADFADGMAAYNRGDYATAFQEWLPLAEQGDAEAQYKFGTLYHNGYGVSKNNIEAIKWYRKAAEQGHEQAQYFLGGMYLRGMYLRGEGIPTNYLKAYMWYSIAKANGSGLASMWLYKLEEHIGPAQIAKAQALTNEYWEKHNN